MKWSYFLFSLVGATVLSGSLLLSSPTSATSTSANASVTVGSACSLTSSGNNSHTATISPGTYTPDIGSTTITVTCNDPGGYALYAIGYTNDEYGTTTLNGASSGQTIATGTNTGSSGNSNWAMKLTPVTGTYAPTIENSFSSYHAVPSTYTRVASFASVTDMGSNATGSKLTTTYAAFIKGDQAADTYAGKVKYTMVHPNDNTPKDGPMACVANKICYSPNANNVVGTMGQQDNSDPNTSTIILLASNFSREGYGFAGWTDSCNYKTDPNAHFYGPQETITKPSDLSSNGLTLYAVWVKSEGSLQNSSTVSSVCGRLTQSGPGVAKTLDSVSALTDQRDGDTYAIAKLADGNCWMIENLRLDNTNSDNSIGALAQGYGTSATYGNFSGLADTESSNFSESSVANSLYYSGVQEGTASVNIGTSGYPKYRMPRYNNINTKSRAQNPTDSRGSRYSYGNYYTWHAAIADLTYNWGNDNDSFVAGTSLCPSGWRLPSGGRGYEAGSTMGVNVTGDPSTFRDYYKLGYSIMGSNKTAYESSMNGRESFYNSSTTNVDGDTGTKAFRRFPNNFLLAGSIRSSFIEYRGGDGSYWSSAVRSYYLSSHMSLTQSTASPGTVKAAKSMGMTIRCVQDSGS